MVLEIRLFGLRVGRIVLLLCLSRRFFVIYFYINNFCMNELIVGMSLAPVFDNSYNSVFICAGVLLLCLINSIQ